MATSLEDLGEKDMLHYFVKRLLVLALDRKDREREMASVMLSSLYAEVGKLLSLVQLPITMGCLNRLCCCMKYNYP